MSFPVTVGLNYGEEKVTTTTKRRALGTRGVTPDGRVFYYAQAGATALVAHKIMQTKVKHGASVHGAGLAIVNATATGVTTLSITVVTTNATRDQYADGYVTVDTSPGQAMYTIKSHPAVASAATGVFTLYDNDPIRDAMTSGTTTVGLQENPYTSVIVSPTTQTGVAIGVTTVAVPAASFCWLQTYGPSLVDVDVAPVAGSSIVLPGASAGNADVGTTVVQDINKQIIGYTPTIGAGADKYNYTFLTIRA